MSFEAVSFFCCGDTHLKMIRADDAFTEEWVWDSRTAPGLNDNERQWFRALDECKPDRIPGQVLITSSGAGGVAVIRLSDKKTLFAAHLPNAHSVETFPNGYLVAAGSVGTDQLVVYSLADGSEVSRLPLKHAHGIVFDAKKNIGWACGDDRLLALDLSTTGVLSVIKEFRIPDADAHDLNPSRTAPGCLDITTPRTAFRFNPETERFNPHPVFSCQPDIKSVDDLPDGRWIYQKAIGGKEWWNDRIQFLNPERHYVLPGVKLYKARWAKLNPFRVS
ncbi:MAG: DUF6528 family protein [Planctomycetota bacterium]